MRLSGVMKRSAVGAAIALAAVPMFASVSSASVRPAIAAPASPAAVALSSGNRSLGASWTESSTGSITFKATATAAGKATRSCITKALHCNIVGLINGVVYDVSVTARNSGGTSAPSTAVSDIVGVPGAPLSVHATAGTASAKIAWAPPRASGVSHVTSYMATANPGGFSCSTSGATPARTCVISGLTSGTKYSVTVTATNAYGTGAPSKTATVTAG
jgi:Fibronectin type III domain